jgi:hypothetical protein
MIELRWKRVGINQRSARDQGLEQRDANWVIIEDEYYAVLQYRETDSDFYYPHIDENGIKTLTRINPEWQDVEISDE